MAHLDGVDILRTSVDKTLMNGWEVVKAYKSLSSVEQAFRSSVIGALMF